MQYFGNRFPLLDPALISNSASSTNFHLPLIAPLKILIMEGCWSLKAAEVETKCGVVKLGSRRNQGPFPLCTMSKDTKSAFKVTMVDMTMTNWNPVSQHYKLYLRKLVKFQLKHPFQQSQPSNPHPRFRHIIHHKAGGCLKLIDWFAATPVQTALKPVGIGDLNVHNAVDMMPFQQLLQGLAAFLSLIVGWI